MSYNLVVLVLPCRDMEKELYCNKMVVLALPCRDMEEELYCNKMVVLVLPCIDVEGGALLQQDDGAVLPHQGQGGVTGISCQLPGRRSGAGQVAARAKKARKRCSPAKEQQPVGGS